MQLAIGTMQPAPRTGAAVRSRRGASPTAETPPAAPVRAPAATSDAGGRARYTPLLPLQRAPSPSRWIDAVVTLAVMAWFALAVGLLAGELRGADATPAAAAARAASSVAARTAEHPVRAVHPGPQAI